MSKMLEDKEKESNAKDPLADPNSKDDKELKNNEIQVDDR